jgi:alpha-beta hydrolase superfamily lysophospholipase
MPRRRRIARYTLVTTASLLLLAGVAYAGVCVWFAVNARSLVFLPVHRISTTPEAAGLKDVAAVAIATEDGERLYGWWKPPAPGHGAIVVLTGKGVIVSDYAGLFGDLAANGFGVLGIDYRGNGVSTGSPSEAGLRADARAAFDFVRAASPPAKIAVLGESLGTWIAVSLAHDRPAAGVLLNSPYASVVRLFELRGLPLPYRWLMADQLDSEALIATIGVPVMILHGTADEAIPIAEARRLYAAAREPKTMIEVEGADHVAVWFGPTRERALAALTAWTAIDPPQPLAGRSAP